MQSVDRAVTGSVRLVVRRSDLNEGVPGDPVKSVLAEAAGRLHAEVDFAVLAEWTADAARRVVGADAAALWLTAPPSGPSWIVSGPLDVPSAVHPATSDRLAPAFQGDATVVIFDLAEPAGRLVVSPDGQGTWPEAAAHPHPPGRSLVAAPITRKDGVALGALVAMATEPDQFGPEDAAALLALATHVRVALDNQRELLHLRTARDTQRSTVDALQAAVLPPRPEVPGVELGSWFEPADDHEPTGGDLWDWFVRPDGALHVAVIDVMGKGVLATKDALTISQFLRFLVLDGCPLVDLIKKAAVRLEAFNPELVATLVVGRYEPATGELQLAGAGHPPVLVVSGGQVREVPAPGIPIGWPGSGSDEVVTVHLERSDSAVFYTDGLIEGTRDIIAGLENLRRYARETAQYPAVQQARVLVARTLADAARRDDSLALVLRRRVPPPATGGHSLPRTEYRLSKTEASVSLARGFFRDWLVRVPVEASAIEDLLLVATELCSNAVRHATWEEGGVTLAAWTEGADVLLEVLDDGPGMVLPRLSDRPPEAESEQGRGLWLVRELSDEVVAVDGPRSGVQVRKRAVSAAHTET